MRRRLIQVNLVIVTVDVDDNTWLVRFLHGIHLLVIIGPQKLRGLPIRQQQGDIAALYPNLHQHKSDFPNNFILFDSIPSHYTPSRWNTNMLNTTIFAASLCPHTLRCWRWASADGTSAGKNASVPIGTTPFAFDREPHEVWSGYSYWPVNYTMFCIKSKMQIVSIRPWDSPIKR